jgi:hypothetical protein
MKKKMYCLVENETLYDIKDFHFLKLINLFRNLGYLQMETFV